MIDKPPTRGRSDKRDVNKNEVRVKEDKQEDSVSLAAGQLLATTPTPPQDHERIADICTRFLVHLFACPEAHQRNGSPSKLSAFISYALRRANLCQYVPFAALLLLRRLKGRVPTAHASCGRALFITAMMIAGKVIVDQAYSNRSWTIIASRIFPQRILNQMEREMCKRLDWELSFDSTMLNDFQQHVLEHFSHDRASYPNYPLTRVSKRAARAAASSTTFTNPYGHTFASLGLTQRSVAPSASCPDLGVTEKLSPHSPMASETSVSREQSEAGDSLARCQSRRLTPRRRRASFPSCAPIPSPQVYCSAYQGVAIQNLDSVPPAAFTYAEKAHPVHPLKMQMFACAVPSKY